MRIAPTSLAMVFLGLSRGALGESRQAAKGTRGRGRKGASVYRTGLEALECRRLLSTYYVATSGNDSGAGSADAPFKSLQKAADTVVAGDTVIVRAGTYGAGFVLGWDTPQGGTAGAPIVFEADPSARAGSVVIAGRNGKTPDGIDLETGSDYVTIQGFTVNNVDGSMYRAGIRVSGSQNVQILNNVANRAGKWCIFSSFTTDLLVQGNTASNALEQHGIYISNSAVRPVVRGNLIFGNAVQGLHLNGDVSQGGSGVVTGALIENNIIRDNGSNGINGDGLQDSRIQNNVIYGNAKHGISLYQIDASGASQDNFIANNTIVQPNSSGAAVQLKDGATGNVLVNNFLMGGDYGSVNIADDSLSGFYSDYNAVNDRFRSEDTDDLTSLGDWQKAHGQDAHSIVANASSMFVNSGAHDFHLKAAGKARHAGTKAAHGKEAPAYDFAGAARSSTAAYDIGAFASPDDSVPVVTPPPTLLSVLATAISKSGAKIGWKTDEVADTQVVYGTTEAYGLSSKLNKSRVKSHAVTLAKLLPGTVYHYQVQSTNAAGVMSVSGDFVFTTAVVVPRGTGTRGNGLSSLSNVLGLLR